MIGVGDKFPEFTLNGVSGNMSFNEDWKDADHDFIKVNSWDLSDWSVIYFYPKDFTFICPTEIVGMDSLMAETDEVYGISPDNEYCKWEWKTGDEHAPLYGVQHALLADCNNNLATSLGIAFKSKHQTTLLIGDLSFIYDQSSLMLAKQLKINLTIVIINNNGGGIFSLLPVSEGINKKIFTKYWTTPQNIDIKNIIG